MRAKTVTIPRLIAAREFFRINPNGRLSTGLWDDPVWTRATFQRWLMRCIHEKINRDVPDPTRFIPTHRLAVVATFRPSRKAAVGRELYTSYINLKPGEPLQQVRGGKAPIFEARPFGPQGSRSYAVLNQEQVHEGGM